MAELKIPQQYHLGLRKIMELSNEAVDRLLSALSEAPPVSDEKGLAQAVEPKIPEIASDDLGVIIETLSNLRSVTKYFDITADAFARDICTAISKGAIEGLTADSSDACLDRLKRFFDNEALGIPSRIIGMMRDHKYMFCQARIFSDIRPIFGSDVEQEPTAAVIVHTLKIQYHEGEELKDFYFAMDSGDIEALRKVLDRADAKAKSLRSVLEKAKVLYLDIR